MRKHLSTIILLVILIIGLSLLLYPTLSDYWNSLHQSRVISNYNQKLNDIGNEEYDKLLEQADAYNRKLALDDYRFGLSDNEMKEYNSILNPFENGMIGYIEIPSIKRTIPIYHGTSEAVLQIAVGHVEGTSLPVGGIGTHSAISGHRGLPSAKLFTDIDKLVVKDLFVIRVLDEVYTYEVDQILIVEPDELDPLAIDPEMDYCTLITCTPYGINSHRLLIRGHRVDNQLLSDEIRVTADALQIEPVIVAPLVAIPLLLILFVYLIVSTNKKKKQKGEVTL